MQVNTVDRSVIARVLLCLAFFSACSYYDPGVNLSFLFYSSMFLLAAAITSKKTNLDLQQDNLHLVQLLDTVCMLFLGLICLHYLFLTQSPDSSFAASMSLAAAPLAAMIAIRIGAEKSFTPLFWIVGIFTVVSALRFLIWDHRAHDPLLDPGNYLTLAYLAFVPWLHQQLTRLQPQGGLSWLLFGVASLAFVVTVLATHSRFAWLVLIALFIYWGLLWLLRRIVNGRGLVLFFACCVLGTGLYSMQGEAEISQNVGASVETENVTSPRNTLLKTTLAMIGEEGALVGQGLSTFPLYYGQKRDPNDQNTVGLYVHNDFLQLLFEGGVFMALPFLLLAAAAVWFLFDGLRSTNKPVGHLGYFLALGLALLHAQLNFVVYVLPLAILVGVITACAFCALPNNTTAGVRLSLFRGFQRSVVWRVGLVVYAVTVAFLGLDVFNYGVFANQKGVPGATWVRDDAHRMERYAELSTSFNSRRGVPKFATAELKRQRLSDAASDTQLEAVLDEYRQAIATDPWNPSAYVRTFGLMHARGIGSTDDQAMLLEQAIAIAPQDGNVAATAIEFYAEVDPRRALELGMQITVWCELIAKLDKDSLNRLGRTLAALNRETQSAELNARLDACRDHLLSTKATQRRATILQNFWLNRDAT